MRITSLLKPPATPPVKASSRNSSQGNSFRPTSLSKVLFDRGLVGSFKEGIYGVEYGQVEVDGRMIRDPHHEVSANASIWIHSCVYVSRAGYKLQAALKQFGDHRLTQNADQPIAMDIGANVGGFTQCLLEFGRFARVHAIESVPGQLHPKLLNDSRVISYSGVDVRKLDPSRFPVRAQLIAVDVGHLPVLSILRHLAQFLAPNGLILAMVKPAYEFPGLLAVIDYIDRNGLRQVAFRPDFSPQTPARVLETLPKAIRLTSYKRRMLKRRITQRPIKIERNFQRFVTGAKIMGFSCLDRVTSPVTINRNRWEEFFLLKPDFDFYA